MSFQTEIAVTAHKPHRCEICQGRISPGTRYLRLVGKHDGDFYADRAHKDCRDLWGAAFEYWGDHNEGMMFDLVEVFLSSDDEHAVRDTLNALRGYYPHAVCRVEFKLRNWMKDGDA